MTELAKVHNRKNWMFSKTAKGAKSSALLYSIVETAKANGLAVERYLVYLFEMLANAEFKIRNAQGQFVNVGTGNAITFGTEAAGTVFTSDANGKFEIKGLPYGTYVLVETKAPAGYALPTNPETEFIVNAVSYVQGSEQNIVNKKVTIPQTGGIGTLAFTVIGAILMILSIVFYKKTSQA